jgi:hypothetical protein
VAGILFSTGALADEQASEDDLAWKALPDYTQKFDTRSFESIKYGKGLKVKGWRFGDGVHFGGVKVDGEYGPGVVFDKGGYVWGFNHERIQFRLRF